MAVEDRLQGPTYSSQQIERYYDRISLPQSHRRSYISKESSAVGSCEDLHFLKTLVKYQLAAVPFENLDLHYSTHHTISLDPAHLFQKIVDRNAGRGGYCMENNAFFGAVLRSLNYDVMTVGARVNEAMSAATAKSGSKKSKYNGWSHMVLIVTMSPRRYLVDVGFGASGNATHPLPLIADQISLNVPPSQRLQLVWTSIPQHHDASQRVWELRNRNRDDGVWTPVYCFIETEFLPEDYAVMSHFTSTSRTSWFTRQIVCTKWILDEKEEVVGNVILWEKVVKRWIRGESEVLATLESEEDRVRALKEHLGVTLNEIEARGIKGMVSELS